MYTQINTYTIYTYMCMYGSMYVYTHIHIYMNNIVFIMLILSHNKMNVYKI